LQNALISAFSADELTRLVRIHLDENLDAIEALWRAEGDVTTHMAMLPKDIYCE